MDYTPLYISMLEKAARAGASRARDALSSILDREITLANVEASVMPLKNIPGILGDVESEVVAILMELTPEHPGNILLIIYFDSARNIAEHLVSLYAVSAEEAAELSDSALEETGNMMLTSFLNAVAETTGIPLEPLPPLISRGPCAAIMDYILITYDQFGDNCVFIKTDFSDYAQSMRANILFLPYPETSDKLADAATSTGGAKGSNK